MSLLAGSWGLRFCISRKGGTEEAGGCIQQRGCFWVWLYKSLGWYWVGYFSPPLHESAWKTVFWPFGASISNNEVFLGLHMRPLAESRGYWKLVNEWLCLSRKSAEDGCKGSWVKLFVKSQGNRRYSICVFKGPISLKCSSREFSRVNRLSWHFANRRFFMRHHVCKVWLLFHGSHSG